jgi:hypothetical protein
MCGGDTLYMHFSFLGLVVGAGWIFGFFVPLVVMVWGWIRWLRREKRWSILSLSSLVAFALASASALLGATMMTYQITFNGPTYDDSSIMRICGSGALISLSASVFALIGVWRANPIRWHALICSFGTFVFWLMAGMGE